MDISDKIKLIRKVEKITQAQLCDLAEISISTLKKIEAGYQEPSLSTISKITNYPRFEKYALWLVTDKTAPEAGQISPALAHSGQENETLPRSEKKTG
ncbi:helix-turn-helix domain-containing protein [Morganella morganii]|uniref:helix-turn-helix domain-containing protein n=1 Tax=Morganella morganii TaxID=582 RepID=UPI000C998157|nr:helix-turn-helix transcriptional regulator [Morganella morganii]HDT0713887.1 helix-turn-helix transcriptional regulator [Morganella morganii subsp. morganii]AUR29992.1 transcriptional regulator [Morganella morganii]EKT0592572.1 helix-turn-helix transcriptional regulator [Morganella morganii]EKV4237843.1 helix-turn-helix transcriptional regulator [Morganella morganii]ELB3893910.1 helix-turn-helix transcriptional regulator [Morganella morganii]